MGWKKIGIIAGIGQLIWTLIMYGIFYGVFMESGYGYSADKLGDLVLVSLGLGFLGNLIFLGVLEYFGAFK